MKSVARAMVWLANDETGSETMEYALIVGLIVVAAIAVISAIGTRVFGRWTPAGSSP